MKPSEEIAYAISQVATLDNKIRELNRERAVLLQKINYVRSPMISQIPPEVLSRIFWFSTRPYSSSSPHHQPHLSDTKVLFQLSAVCSHWRCNIQSSPQLWTTLVLEQKKSKEQTLATDYVALVKHHFQRLGLGAATMSVYISDFPPLTSAMIGEIVRVLLREHLRKLGSLHFIGNLSDSFWPHIFKYAKENIEFAQLGELELPWLYSEHPLQNLFCNVPHLRTLSLHGGGNWHVALGGPWKQITTLKLYGMHLADSFQLLSLCPNLINCKVSNHRRSYRTWVPEQRQPIPMQFVQKLTWTAPGDNRDYDRAYPNSVDSEFFMRFLFPAVRKLKWHAPLPSNAPFIQDFFAGMQELEALEFSFLKAARGACIDRHVEVFVNLRMLEANLIGCSGKDLRQRLYRLTVKPGGNNPMFPRLERLHLTIGVVTPHELIVVLHSRRSAPVDWFEHEKDYFGLTLPPYDPVSAHWQHRARLLEFSCKYEHDGRDQEWGWSPYYDALKDMIKEAKEVEGFDYFDDRRCRMRF